MRLVIVLLIVLRLTAVIVANDAVVGDDQHHETRPMDELMTVTVSPDAEVVAEELQHPVSEQEECVEGSDRNNQGECIVSSEALNESEEKQNEFDEHDPLPDSDTELMEDDTDQELVHDDADQENDNEAELEDSSQLFESGGEDEEEEGERQNDDLLHPSPIATDQNTDDSQRQHDDRNHGMEAANALLSSEKPEKSTEEELLLSSEKNTERELTDLLHARISQENERALTCERSLIAMEHHLEKVLIEHENNQAVVDTSLQQQLRDVQTQLEQERGAVIYNKDLLTTCENTLMSVERLYELLVVEHEKNHSIVDTTVAQLHHQITELETQLESQQRASLQATERLGKCESSLQATKDHYETRILHHEKSLFVADTTLMQLQQQVVELQQQLAESNKRAIVLVEEQMETCDKTLTDLKHHIETLVAEHQANQTATDSILLQMQEQIAGLQERNVDLEERAAAQSIECVASCEKSLDAQEQQYQTHISELQRNHSITDKKLVQVQQNVVELQSQISGMEQRALDTLQESKMVWEQEKLALIAQAAQNLTTAESQWQHRQSNLRIELARLQQVLKHERQEHENLRHRFYSTRQDMFATYRSLHAHQAKSTTGKRHTKRSIAWMLTGWAYAGQPLASTWKQLKEWVTEATERIEHLQAKIHQKLEEMGVSDALRHVQNSTVPAAFHHLEKTTDLVRERLSPITIRPMSWPGVIRCLQLRRLVQGQLANVVRVTSHLVLAFCHVTRVSQQRQSHSWFQTILSWLKWTYQHSEEAVQRTEQALWFILAAYLMFRTKLWRILFWRRKKRTQRQPPSQQDSKTNAVIIPPKIKPAFRNTQQ